MIFVLLLLCRILVSHRLMNKEKSKCKSSFTFFGFGEPSNYYECDMATEISSDLADYMINIKVYF